MILLRVVTQFAETQVTQFFIQDGKRIDAPAPTWEGLPKQAGLSPEMCEKLPSVFGNSDGFGGLRTWEAHKRMLSQPMVLTMSIDTDVSLVVSTFSHGKSQENENDT